MTSALSLPDTMSFGNGYSVAHIWGVGGKCPDVNYGPGGKLDEYRGSRAVSLAKDFLIRAGIGSSAANKTALTRLGYAEG